MSKPLPRHTAANTSMNTLTIPQHWSAEQALAVYELLNDIQAQIWKQYDLKLIALLRQIPMKSMTANLIYLSSMMK